MQFDRSCLESGLIETTEHYTLTLHNWNKFYWKTSPYLQICFMLTDSSETVNIKVQHNMILILRDIHFWHGISSLSSRYQ